MLSSLESLIKLYDSLEKSFKSQELFLLLPPLTPPPNLIRGQGRSKDEKSISEFPRMSGPLRVHFLSQFSLL